MKLMAVGRASPAAFACVLLTVALVGCVLVVPPLDVSRTCAIEGASDCAACIRTSCQVEVNGCCGDEACARPTFGPSLLEAVDACGRGGSDACDEALRVGPQTAAGEAMRACIVKECPSSCAAGRAADGGVTLRPWSCESPRTPTIDCARCVYSSCAEELDRCCSQPSCAADSEMKEDVAACVGGDVRGCAYSRQRSSAGEAGIVRRCLVESCGEACMGDGLPHTRCSIFGGGTSCSCSDAPTSGESECTSALVGGECVLGTAGCRCGSYSCTSSYRKCGCGFDGDAPGEPCTRGAVPEATRCCLLLEDRGVSCVCDDWSESCEAERGEFSIESCEQSAVMAVLESANRVVTTCSR